MTYGVSKLTSRIVKLTPLGSQAFVVEGSRAKNRSLIELEYDIFDSFEEAEYFATNKDDIIKAERAAKEEAIRIEQEKDMELLELARMARDIHIERFKLFVKQTAFIDRKILNKALFAVTLDRRFNGWLYNYTNDSQLAQILSIQVMDEVIDMLS